MARIKKVLDPMICGFRAKTLQHDYYRSTITIFKRCFTCRWHYNAPLVVILCFKFDICKILCATRYPVYSIFVLDGVRYKPQTLNIEGAVHKIYYEYRSMVLINFSFMIVQKKKVLFDIGTMKRFQCWCLNPAPNFCNLNIICQKTDTTCTERQDNNW